MIEVQAPAKVNFTLRVSSVDRTGLHPIESRVQMVGWFDTLTVDWFDEDVLEISGPADRDAIGGELTTGGQNLVWKGAAAFWSAQVSLKRRPVRVHLSKQIPTAAGLAGGSADAAGMAVALGALTRHPVNPEDLAEVGSDVPFALVGGAALMEGYGEVLSPLPVSKGFALGVAVPPLVMSTPEVYREWDRLDGPTGTRFPARSAPPSLREVDLINDLFPAAAALAPQLLDHCAELSQLWERPVAMSGSGPSLFGFFADEDEASDAVAATTGMRSVRAVVPVSHGARVSRDESDYTDTVRR